jgi:hypothetical protein
METFTKLFGSLLVLYIAAPTALSSTGTSVCCPGRNFVRTVFGNPVVSKEVLSQRTNNYRN